MATAIEALQPRLVVIENVRQTVTAIREKSAAVDRAITEGRTAIVGAIYNLEAGTVTPKPQKGNPAPRVFRSADAAKPEQHRLYLLSIQ